LGLRGSTEEIVVNEVMIRVGPDLSEAALRRILRAVRSA
jgi:transposase